MRLRKVCLNSLIAVIAMAPIPALSANYWVEYNQNYLLLAMTPQEAMTRALDEADGGKVISIEDMGPYYRIKVMKNGKITYHEVSKKTLG